ncbi:HAMP domain-containing sensor histidine kinase [Streptomyces triticirhizae]|uniref:histidine kinase n=1 Tax=Streptomyces triticirhizae TaxID=2483353 RepID=A0A3M2LPY8_9ACTN|nr:HAMP domain-containing sensor histidine kinase [Streptomyces triticirhizae]RMI39477.1 sensor histidine kinase [Streptomyces triticirhizae]
MRWWRSLRVRLAVLGFLGGYVPVLLLFGVLLVTETENVEQIDGGVSRIDAGFDAGSDAGFDGEAEGGRSPWVAWTVVALGPAAAGVAWWWAGRVVRPIEGVRRVAEEIEESDLSRRIALTRGPGEIVSLAASFDAMLGRLETAATTQRRLVEETSHELRVPLSVLVTNAEVLLAHPDPDLDLLRQGLARSHRAAERLGAVIDQLLVEARGRARTLDRAPVDLAALVRGVVEDASVLAEARRMALWLDAPERAVCAVDGPTVRRAVANLVDNALRYALAGTPVRVAVELTATEASVTVTDRGPGVPEEQRERIFERFWRGRPDTEGSGLGLPIAHQVARAHGGRVTVADAHPGSTFRLTLRR